jgi:hypothetical protein
MQKPVDERRIPDRRLIELFPSHGRANDGKDARADHRANAQRCQRPWPERLFEAVFRRLGVADELVD